MNCPLWLRVALYAEEGRDGSGHRRLFSGELSGCLGVSPKEVSRAIRRAVFKGVLNEQSSARCLVVGDSLPSACPAVHRSSPGEAVANQESSQLRGVDA